MVHHFLLKWKEQADRRGEQKFEVIGIADFVDEKVQNMWFEEKVPEAAKLALGESRCLALEILDDLFIDVVGFSIFEKIASLDNEYPEIDFNPNGGSVKKSKIQKFDMYSDHYSDEEESIKPKKPQLLDKDMYSVKILIQILKLPKTQKRNLRKD